MFVEQPPHFLRLIWKGTWRKKQAGKKVVYLTFDDGPSPVTTPKLLDLLDEHDIFQKYMDIAFADVTDYVSFGRENIQVMGAFGPVMVENKETGEKEVLEKEVNTVKFKQSEEVDGTLITEVKQGKDGASIKLVDKMKALQWLADHMDIATVEQKAKIEQIRAKTEQIRHSETDTGEDAVQSWMDAVKKARESDG